MSDMELFSLEHLPQAALLCRDGVLVRANALALHCLPQLKPGAPLPPCLAGVDAGAAPLQGEFVSGLSRYTFRLSSTPAGTLLVFSPAPQTALTDGQLDGTLRQLRTLMGDLLVQVEAGPESGRPALRKSYFRLFRLMDNLDFLRLAGSGEGAPFSPVTMDLVGLCRQVCGEAATLLEDRGVSLDFRSDRAGMLVSGDPDLLRRLLLELVANSVKAIGTGEIRVRLRFRDKRALLVLSDSGSAPSPRRLNALLQQDSDGCIPEAEAGAGLGLSVVRHIAALHGGALLVEWGQASPLLVLTLPLGPLEDSPVVRTPVERDGGLNPLLVALSDVLPANFFEGDDLL